MGKPIGTVLWVLFLCFPYSQSKSGDLGFNDRNLLRAALFRSTPKIALGFAQLICLTIDETKTSPLTSADRLSLPALERKGAEFVTSLVHSFALAYPKLAHR